MSFEFEVLVSDGRARRGRLTTPHGIVETPAFMPVGTLGAIKGIHAAALEQAGAGIMLSNLYHLALRPGIEVIEEMGGLHSFIGWERPILTDSGGYQVFSLSNLRSVDEGGVTFRSHIDGKRIRFTPESVALQNAIESANMISKQAIKHADVACDRIWNVDEQGYTAQQILQDEGVVDTLIAKILSKMAAAE